ncbi:MAG: DUF4258 domain-containing protein [Terriglobia bacterium]
MARVKIERIREKIRLLQYDMSAHAMEEMAEDGLTIVDVEHAILGGHMVGVWMDDPRGTRYIVEGVAADQRTLVGVVGRLTGSGRYLIITVYRLYEMGG